MAWLNAEEARAVLSAYVLIETEVGKVAHVAQALSDLDGVRLAEDLAGPYDVIARVQASGLDQLGRPVVSRIQGRCRRHPYPDLHGDPAIAACFASPPELPVDHCRASE